MRSPARERSVWRACRHTRAHTHLLCFMAGRGISPVCKCWNSQANQPQRNPSALFPEGTHNIELGHRHSRWFLRMQHPFPPPGKSLLDSSGGRGGTWGPRWAHVTPLLAPAALFGSEMGECSPWLCEPGPALELGKQVFLLLGPGIGTAGGHTDVAEGEADRGGQQSQEVQREHTLSTEFSR